MSISWCVFEGELTVDRYLQGSCTPRNRRHLPVAQYNTARTPQINLFGELCHIWAIAHMDTGGKQEPEKAIRIMDLSLDGSTGLWRCVFQHACFLNGDGFAKKLVFAH